ncbi:MAG: fibronectin type III domain-containing protein [Spirochaetes bacterium]|nr:fibronectin type III domain-containing protein [Spirochaetota bacterium]
MDRVLRMICAAMLSAAPLFISCIKADGFKENPVLLAIEKIEDAGDQSADDGSGGLIPPGDLSVSYHPLYNGLPGNPVQAYAASSYSDASGQNILTDWDGDGIPNEREIAMGTNPYVVDCPRVTIRTDYPIMMELEIHASGETKVYAESIDEENTRTTRSENMDETHYSKLNQKTTPYVVKSSSSDAGSSANSYGYSQANEVSYNSSFNFAYMQLFSMGAGLGYTQKTSKSENWSFSNSFSRSSMSEKTVFEDVNYHDNMDGSGIELKDAKVMEMESRYRNSEIMNETTSYGPNAGVVRAALHFRNESIDKPVKISNVLCTLLLKLPSGKLEALSTFQLKNDDGRPFEVEIGGAEETSPYAVVVDGISSDKIKRAIRNGYIPVVSIFSYDMNLVDDSSYQPGISNLEQVEEAAKGRTAVIKIVAPNMRDIYRVAAFDREADGNVSPGISLKKALYNIFRSPLKGGERWETDAMSRELTVPVEGLWWHSGYSGGGTGMDHEYLYSENLSGNDWDYFATEVKTYTDEYNALHRIETIKRIGSERDVFGNYINQKYNPFNKNDNAAFDENESLSAEELLKTKYWVIMHNGKYFEGDINDPIWAGDRYEIILYNMQDFREHFDHFIYTPLQSGSLMSFDTRWNALANNFTELARSIRLGKVCKGDVVRLDVYLKESRFLFDKTVDESAGAGVPYPVNPGEEGSPNIWWDFNYTTEPAGREPNGIPENFSHIASGGVNSIKVHVDGSRYTLYYIIEMRDLMAASPVLRTMKISSSEMAEQGGDIYITSSTPDINGVPMENIKASTYEISVFAHGQNYGCSVKTRSSTNGAAESRAVVSEASDRIPTNNFSFSAMNMYKNRLFVRISDPPNTEYFVIRCYGPINYSNGSVPVREVVGHSGLNIIEFDHPYDGLQEARDPGVYEVDVFAVNKNCYPDGSGTGYAMFGVASSFGPVYVNVEYDSYQNQRVIAPYKWLPEAERDTDSSVPTRSFNLSAIDLEVNFNEGSGWWRLKLANDDIGESGREIECRYTSIIEDYRGQHFIIYFTPPAAAGGSTLINNVFRSSDNEVDLYIRTVAENRYRDTFWMKNVEMDSIYRDGAYGIITDPGISDFKSYWNGLVETDASKFEQTLEQWRVQAPAEHTPGGPGLIDPEASSAAYFFSPLEQRKYLIGAMIVEPERLVETMPQKLDLPDYDAAPGPECIFVNNIESRYAEYYEVWWRKFERPAVYEIPMSAFEVGWDEVTNMPLSDYSSSWRVALAYPDENGKCKFVIPECIPNKCYIVAVVGKNTYLHGISDARFAFDKNLSGDNIQYIMPYPSAPPADAPLMKIDVDRRNISVGLSSTSEQCRYILEWKVEGDSLWSSYDTFDGTLGSLAWDGTKYIINDLNPRTLYAIRAYAVTLNGIKGPAASNEVETGIDGSIEYMFDWDRTHVIRVFDGFYALDARLMCTIKELPAGTAYYVLEGMVLCDYWHGSIIRNLEMKRIPFRVCLSPTQTTALIADFVPVKKWNRSFYRAWHKNFSVRGTIKAYNNLGVEITPSDEETGQMFDVLTWSYQPCPQPFEDE